MHPHQRPTWPEVWRHVPPFSRECKCPVWFSGKGFLQAEVGMGICIFPIASITNYHKFGGLNKFITYSCGGQKGKTSLVGLKLRHRRDYVPSGSLGESSISCTFLPSEATWTLWFVSSKPATAGQSSSYFITDTDSPASLLQFSGLYIRPTQIVSLF